LKPAKLLLCLDRADDPEIRKFREKKGPPDGDFFRRRDTAVLFSGPAAKDAMASLLSAPHRPSQSMIGGIYSLGLLFYLDEHDRARWSINTTDAPSARILSTQSNSLFIWSIYTPLPPRPGEDSPAFELYTARDFYHKLLPELQRVDPKEIDGLEDFLRKYYNRSLEELINTDFSSD